MANNKKSTTAKNTKKATNKPAAKSTNKAAKSKKTSPKPANKSTKAEQDSKKALQGEILSIVLIGLSLLMFVCVLTNNNDNTGTFGHYIASFLTAAFGVGATVLPIVLLIYSIQTLFTEQKSSFKVKLALFLGFFTVFISLAYIMTRREPSLNSIPEFISAAADSKGGVLGAAIGELLHSLIGSLGSYIVLITALIVLLILATGKSVVGFVTYIGDLIDGVKEDYREYKDNIVYEEDEEDEYEEEEDEPEETPVKRSSKKKKQARGQMKLPIDEDAPSKPQKKSKKPQNERIIAFNLPEEEDTETENDILFDNKFILENNKIYNKPKNTDYKFTSLNDLVNEAGEIRSSKGEHYVYNLPDEEAMADDEIAVNDDTAVNEAADIEDEPPFEPDNSKPIAKPVKEAENNDEIAKAALNEINKPSQGYTKGSTPEIIEAEKTKTLSRLKVIKDADYEFPKLEFLGKNPKANSMANRQEMLDKAMQLEKTLGIFNVNAQVNNISQGPAVTRYELTPPQGVRVKDIVNLENDIALALAARSIRMEAPIPGKSAIGIEIPNDTISMVYFREVLTNEKFQNFKGKIAFGVGKDITGNVIVQDIAKMPHLLIAGSTGSGKSVCINTLITSILYKYTPDQVRLIMIDPKIVELGVYNGIPHLLVPVVTDPQKAAGALNWAVREMMRRYDVFATKGVRNLEGYNETEDIEEKLPQIVVIIDELADLMMVAKKDVEASIQRLTQLARAAGIHLVIATQRPSVNVITGVIKANVPSRIAFKVASSTDSRTILDSSGAEKLLGKGDMLFQAGDMDKPLRIQGAFVTDHEIEKIVNYIKVDDESHYDNDIIREITSSGSEDSGTDSSSGDSEDSDELINDVIRFVVSSKKASTSLIQRKFRIGFNRAARIIDELEDRGIIGPDQGGTKGRTVLMDKYELQEWSERQQNL